MRASGNPLFVQALAAEIKARRNEAGLTQEDLAGASELDRPYITLMEAGRKQPTVSVLWRIGQGLNVPASVLLAGAERRYAAAAQHRHRMKMIQTKSHFRLSSVIQL